MSPEEHKILAHRWLDLWNQWDTGLVDALYAADFVFNGEPFTIERYKQLVVNHHAAFPDGVGTVEYTFGEGDRVAIRVVFHGTHQGTFLGPTGSVTATGRQITWNEITILRSAEGRIVEETTEIDWLRVLQQLGVIPTNA